MVVVLVVGIINKIPYVEKFWRGKKLANLANRMPFANFLPTNHSLLQSVVAIQAAHSPIFYPPIGSDWPIRQYFPPPKFSHVRYSIEYLKVKCCKYYTVYNHSLCNDTVVNNTKHKHTLADSYTVPWLSRE